MQLGDRELGNLRAAMGWAFANGQARLGMAMANDLWRYFYEQATGSNENVRWGRLALDIVDEDDDDVMSVAAGALIEAYNLSDVAAMEASPNGSGGAWARCAPRPSSRGSWRHLRRRSGHRPASGRGALRRGGWSQRR